MCFVYIAFAETLDALSEAIKEFKGGVLVISHDQHFLNAVCKELWLVGDGTVKPFRGTFNDYKKQVMQEVAAAAASAATAAAAVS